MSTLLLYLDDDNHEQGNGRDKVKYDPRTRRTIGASLHFLIQTR